MTLLEWKDQYSLGNEALDHEHRELIRLINVVHGRIEGLSDQRDVKQIQAGLSDIHNAVSAHFALEEREMQTKAYAEMDSHKADHEKLLDEISDLVDAVEEAAIEDLRESLSAILEAWFSTHFQTFDRDFHVSTQGG